MRKCFVFIAMVFLFVACQTGTGEIVEKAFPDGSPQVVNFYEEIDGLKVIVRTVEYYKSGNKSKEGAVLNGARHGVWLSWYEDGTKWSEGEFVNGKSDGEFKSYATDGSLVMESFYKEGVPVGTWKLYTNGKLDKELVYEDGKIVHERNAIEGAPVK